MEERKVGDEAVDMLFTNSWSGLHIVATTDLVRAIAAALADPAARAQSAAGCTERLRAHPMEAALAEAAAQLRASHGCV